MRIFLLLLLTFIFSCDTKKDDRTTVENRDTIALPPPIESKPVEVINWDYYQKTDEMTEKVSYFATCVSNNQAHFDFPYEGGSRLTLTIRKRNGVNEVILSISKGQFSSSYSGSVKIKFDNEQPRTYTFNEPADYSSDYIFLNGSSSIIAKLKKASKVKIQPPFFQHGQVVFEFDVAGLKWEH